MVKRESVRVEGKGWRKRISILSFHLVRYRVRVVWCQKLVRESFYYSVVIGGRDEEPATTQVSSAMLFGEGVTDVRMLTVHGPESGAVCDSVVKAG